MRKLTTLIGATLLALSLVSCNKSSGGTAVIETDLGQIKIQLDGATAPKSGSFHRTSASTCRSPPSLRQTLG